MTPVSWSIVKLSDLANMCLGKMLDQNKNKGTYYPYLANTNVRWGEIELDNLREMKFELKEFDRYGLKPGDIVMCEGGEPGRCAIWKGQTQSMMIQKALHRIRVKGEVDCVFLYYALLNSGLQGHFEGYFTGAAIKHLTGENLAKVKVSIPDLPTQQKIAHILSAYDDLIENNLKRIKLLEEMAQITYEQWFVRMEFPGHETTPIDAETGLPDGWKELAISDLCVVNGSSISKKNAPNSIKYIDIASVNTGDYEIPQTMSFATAPSRARRKVKFGDTIFSTVRPNRKIYSLILDHNPALVASTGFATLTPIIPDTHSFVYLSVANQSFVDRAVAVAGGAAYPAVNQTDFEKITIIFPGKELIQKFSEIYNQYFDLVGNLKRQNIHLKEARDILLPRLMTGMIDVDHIKLPKTETDTEAA